jgi:hypothetical protein
MTRRVRLITELVGTFIFLSAIALSGPVGPLAPLAIGTALMAIGFTITAAVFTGGPISGGAFNPAVGFGATGVGRVRSRRLVGPLDLRGRPTHRPIGAGIHRLMVSGEESRPGP